MLMEELMRLLESADMNALDCFARIQASGTLPPGELVQALDKAIQNLDFELALNCCIELIRQGKSERTHA